ncbi:hypothetical protein HDU98_000449 [Podochytrium sp. JEL0797]|nr:hypothetical protein HDU98_000449 [Podochytrium sp. JEL0797]
MDYKMLVTRNPTELSQTKDPLSLQYHQNPRCNAKNVHDLTGRWISTNLIPPEFRDHHVPNPSSPGRGSAMTFLPDACTIYYFSDAEALQCLDKKRFLIIGDSTSNELALDLGMHLFMGKGDHWPKYFVRESDDWSVENVIRPGGDTGAGGCDAYMIQRQFWWPIKVGRQETQITKFWSPRVNPCGNGGGSISVEDPIYLERIQRALFEPGQIANFTFDNDPNATQKSPLPTLKETIQNGTPTDFVVFNTLLHDLMTPSTMSGTGYGNQMDLILKGIKPGAKFPVYMLSNAKVGSSDVAVRHFNDVMRKVAPANGFFVYDAHSVQVGRLTGVGTKNPIFGDLHHGTTWKDDEFAWQRTPFTHVPTQVFLNMFCQ